MAVKHFLVNPNRQSLPKNEILKLEQEKLSHNDNLWSNRKKKADEAFVHSIPLKAPVGRVIVKVNVEYKNEIAFNGTSIRLERQFNNLNRRETEPVNAWVIAAENIPTGAEILVHHNAIHDNYRIFDCEDLIEGEKSTDIQYFSIKEADCFLWRAEGEADWNPCTVYDTGLRIFEPYKGVLDNIPPKKLKDVLFITSGKLKGKAVATLKGCDYCIIFNDINAVEQKVIRFRPFGDKANQREPEALAELKNITKRVLNGELLVGYDQNDCKTFYNNFNKIK